MGPIGGGGCTDVKKLVIETEEYLQKGNYSPGLKALRDKFKEALVNNKDGLIKKAIESKASIQDELQKAIQETKNLSLKKFNKSMKKRPKEQEKIQSKLKEDNLSI